jgi:hypothetical protein
VVAKHTTARNTLKLTRLTQSSTYSVAVAAVIGGREGSVAINDCGARPVLMHPVLMPKRVPMPKHVLVLCRTHACVVSVPMLARREHF